MTSPVKPTFKTEIIPIILILAAIVSSFYFYANFPNQVPIHWNLKGQVDNYGGKAFGAFFFPALTLAIYLLFLGLPYIDPKKSRYQEFAKPYHIFKAALVILMVMLYFVSSAAALGYPVSISTIVPAAIGFLFIIIGNYLGKIKSNWFMGIRTPWTLSNEEVWNKTNRLGGKLFVILGVLMIAGVFRPTGIFWRIFMAGVFLVVIWPVLYSYFLYKKISK